MAKDFLDKYKQLRLKTYTKGYRVLSTAGNVALLFNEYSCDGFIPPFATALVEEAEGNDFDFVDFHYYDDMRVCYLDYSHRYSKDLDMHNRFYADEGEYYISKPLAEEEKDVNDHILFEKSASRCENYKCAIPKEEMFEDEDVDEFSISPEDLEEWQNACCGK